jgi:hypothetical protein
MLVKDTEPMMPTRENWQWLFAEAAMLSGKNGGAVDLTCSALDIWNAFLEQRTAPQQKNAR